MLRRLVVLSGLAVLGGSFVTPHARAEGAKPIQLSLVPSIQIVDEAADVSGVRLMIVGRNANVTGLDVGLGALTTGEFVGLQWAAVGMVGGGKGWMNNAIYSGSKGVFRGLQTSAVCMGDDVRGVQFGLVNYNKKMNGLQISFFNYAEYLDGLQIGIINVAKNAQGHTILPIVNWVF